MKKNNPVVSIIVPVYNVGDSIYRCVNSLKSQTYSSIEIVLVNDGSTDNSGKTIDELAEDDGRIKVIHQNNGGVTQARKNGWKMSSGELCMFVDADDFLEKDAVEFFVEQFNVQDYDFITGWYDCVYENDEIKKICCPYTPGVYLPEEYAIQSIHDAKGFEPIWIGMYKREMFDDEVFNIDRKIYRGEDSTTLLGAMNKMKKILITDKIFYHYFQRSDSVTHTRHIDIGYILKLKELQYNRTNFKKIYLPEYFKVLLSYYYTLGNGKETEEYRNKIFRLYNNDLLRELDAASKIKLYCLKNRFSEYLLKSLLKLKTKLA